MSKFMICHMQKFKQADIKGLQIHNQREKESHSNPDIQHEKTGLNYDLLHGNKKVEYKDLIQQRMKDGVVSNRTIRKDAVVCCSFMISASPEYMSELSPEQEKQFFKESLYFLQDRYRKDNIVYASVHKDEKTPHMHVGFVPINDKQKLSAYSFFKHKSELHDLQDKIYEHIKNKNFDIERGVSSDRKHLSTQRYKAETIKKEIENLEEKKQQQTQSLKETENRLGGLKQSLENVKPLDQIEIKEIGLFSSRSVKLSREDYQSIRSLAMSSEVLKTENKQLEDDIEKMKVKNNELKNKNVILERENERLRKANKLLTQENRFLHRTIDKIKQLCRDKVQNLDLLIGYMKTEILQKMKMPALKKYFGSKDEEKGGTIFLHEQPGQKEKNKKLDREDEFGR